MLKPVHLLPAMVVLGVVGVIVLSLLIPASRKVLWPLTVGGYLLVVLWAFFESFVKYKSLKAALLSPITLSIQVFAYGFGLLKALWQTKVLGKKEARGFVKGYYGKKKSR